MKIALAILVFNEIVGLKRLFSRIPFSAVDEYFVIDGGSTDGSREFLKERGVTVYDQSSPGRAEAFHEAFRRTTCDAVIFFSPDGNEEPEDIVKFKPFLERGDQIVIGTRMVPGARNEEDGKALPLRKWVNLAFTLIINVIWNRGTYVTDTINGFRAIRLEAWRRIGLDGPGYTVEFQGMIRAFKLGLKIGEFPTREEVRFDGRDGSPSLPTRMAFLKILVLEILRGRRWKALPGA